MSRRATERTAEAPTDLVFLQHDVAVYEGLLEVQPVGVQVVKDDLHVGRDRHLVLRHDLELLGEWPEARLDLRLLPVQLLPQLQAISQLVEVLRRPADPGKGGHNRVCGVWLILGRADTTGSVESG